MKIKIIKAVGYTLFFCLCLFFFVLYGLPVQAIWDKASAIATQRAGVKLTAASLSPLFPVGFKAIGVRVVKPPEGESDLGLSLSVEKLSARVGLFAYLFGRQSLSFQADLLSGRVTGSVSAKGDTQKIDLQAHDLQLANIPVWKDKLGVELEGKVEANVDLEISTKDAKASQGTISLQVEKGRFGNGKISMLELPWINMGKTEVNLVVSKGKAEIKTAKVASDDIDLALDGYFLLQQRLDQMTSNCRIRFKPSEAKMTEIFSKVPELKGLVDAQMEPAKGDDGYFRYSMYGRVIGAQPSFRPQKR